MFIIFGDADITINLQKFNRWAYLNGFIKKNQNLFSENAKQFLADWSYAAGFGNSEEWVLKDGEVVCQLLQEVDPQKHTKRWAEPIRFVDRPWIAMPLPEEWSDLPRSIQDEALEKLGHGSIVDSLPGDSS